MSNRDGFNCDKKYWRYKCGCTTAMESITYHRGSLETVLKNGSDCAKITKTSIYQRGSLYKRVGMCQFFFKWQQLFTAAQYRNSIATTQPKFICCYQNQNPKSNISNSTHTQFKIQYLQYQHILNSKFKFP